jgi:CheY-like chemotaxis protein
MARTKILLVDDRAENLLALEAILGVSDHELVRATSGEEALKALLTDEFAVILLDVAMPGMDGLETARLVKGREKTRDVPIIFLTAVHPDAEHAFRGYTAGAVDYVSKPFDPWVLRAKVAVFVELHRKSTQLREQAALLRGRLESDAAGDGLTEALSFRLSCAEQAYERACASAPSANGLGELGGELARLRAVVDALRPGSPHPAAG